MINKSDELPKTYQKKQSSIIIRQTMQSLSLI